MAAQVLKLPVKRAEPDVQDLLRQFNRLKGMRGAWDAHWQEVKDRVWPHGADFTQKRQPGDKRTEQMLDATAALDLEKFSAVLESLLTPRQNQWHKLVPTDDELKEDSEVKAWLEDALFQPQTRAAFRALLALGLTDGLRACQPEAGLYTFWDYQAGAWQKNNGIRIDHVLLSPQAADRLTAAGIDKAVRGRLKPSDHVPVWIDLDIATA